MRKAILKLGEMKTPVTCSEDHLYTEKGREGESRKSIKDSYNQKSCSKKKNKSAG